MYLVVFFVVCFSMRVELIHPPAVGWNPYAGSFDPLTKKKDF